MIWDKASDPAAARYIHATTSAIDEAIGNVYTQNDLDTAVAELHQMGLPWTAELIRSRATGAPVNTEVPNLLTTLASYRPAAA